jgi:hypothetical protein
VTGDDGDREQRQYLLMQQRIAAFRAGQLSLGRVIADLEGLLSALEQATEEWKDRFREQCNVLEIAYAVTLDRQDPPPTAGDHDIAAALDAMESLLHERAT